MHYRGGIRFPRASFLGYYEKCLPPTGPCGGFGRPSLQLLDNAGTPGSQILPSLDLFRPTAALDLFRPTARAGSVSPYRASPHRRADSF
jgi:hypothetical protein